MQSVNSGLKPGATLYRASGTSMARYGTAFVTAMIPSRHGFPEPLFQISRFDYHLVLPTCDIISDVTERERSQHSERTTNGPEHTDCSPPRLRQRSKVLKNPSKRSSAPPMPRGEICPRNCRRCKTNLQRKWLLYGENGASVRLSTCVAGASAMRKGGALHEARRAAVWVQRIT
jgi:ribosomal protein L28